MIIKRVLVLVVVATLMVMGLAALVPSEYSNGNVSATDVMAAYTPAARLRIDSNAGFTPGNGFTGSGTSGDPYVLASRSIDAAGGFYSIYIGNTTAYFIIRDCYLFGATSADPLPDALPYRTGSGIVLNNVVNGKVENCLISTNTRGATLLGAVSTVFANNTVSDNAEEGLLLEQMTLAPLAFSTDDIVFNNTFDSNLVQISAGASADRISYVDNILNNTGLVAGAAGMQLSNAADVSVQGNVVNDMAGGSGGIVLSYDAYGMTNFDVSNNTVTGCSYGIVFYSFFSSSTGILADNVVDASEVDGITLAAVDTSQVLRNTVSNSAGNGISLSICQLNTVANNSISTSGLSGILVWSSNSNIIEFNVIMDSSERGIYVDQGLSNVLHDNQISYNLMEGVGITVGPNEIYRNYFFANNGSSDIYSAANVQAWAGDTNVWYDTVSGLGNNWGDWTVPDAYRDGIVDLPYDIAGVAQSDPFPLSATAAPPGNLALTAGSGYVDLTWDAANYSICGPIVNYLIYRNGSVSPIGFVDGATLTYTDSAVLPETTYTYWLTALNLMEGWPGPEQSITTPAVGAFQVAITSPADMHISLVNSVTVQWGMSSGVATLYESNLDGAGWASRALTTSLVLSGLADGQHVFQVRATGGLGETSLAQITFYVDTVAPLVTIYDPANNTQFATTSVLVSWVVEESGAGVDFSEYRIDAGGWTNGGAGISQSHTFTGLGQGQHIIEVRATDLAGRTGAAANLYIFVDSIGPSTVISSPADGAYIADTTVTVNWNGTDGGVGVSYFEVRIDGGFWTNVGNVLTYTTPALSEAVHTVYVRGVDALGNAGTPDSVTFTVDVTGPTVTFVPPTPANINVTTWTVTWTGNDGIGSGVAKYEVNFDSGGWTDYAMLTTETYASLSEAAHSVQVRATDNLGNVGAVATYNFRVDLTAPVVTITFPPAGWVNSTARVAWSGVDAGSGIAYYEYSIDGGTWTNVGLDVQHIFNGLSFASHTVLVRANDSAGNLGLADSVTFSIDIIPPVVTIQSPSNGTLFKVVNVTVQWTGTDDVSGIAYYEYRIDGGSWMNAAMATSHAFTGLSDGTHVVQVRANDTAGNMCSARTVTFVVDATAPVVTITQPTEGFINQPMTTVAWTVVETGTGVAYYEIKLDGGSWNYAGTVMTWTLSNLTQGGHTVYVRANDSAGNMGAAASLAFVVDLEAPVVTIIDPIAPAYLDDGNVTVAWTGSDPLSGIKEYYYRLDGSNWTLLGLNTLVNLTGLADGSHLAEVKAMDKAGNIGYGTVTFVVDTVAPTASILSPEEGAKLISTTVTVDWEAADAGSGIGEMKLWNGEDWVDVTGTSYELEGLIEGINNIQLWVADRAGNYVTVEVNVTVDLTPPTVLSKTPVGENVALTAVISITFSEAMDKDSVVISVGGVGGVVTWDGNKAIFSRLAPLQRDLSYDVIVNGRDVAGKAMAQYTWTFTTVLTKATVGGRVFGPDELSLANADVRLNGVLMDRTDALGEYMFFVDPGTYTLDIGKEGMKNITLTVTYTMGQIVENEPVWLENRTTGLDIGIIATVVALAAVLLVVVVWFVRKGKK